MDLHKHTPRSCSGKCDACASGGEPAESTAGGWSGSAFVYASISVFLLPLVGAVAGAWCARTTPQLQALTGLAGLAVGASISVWCIHLLKKTKGMAR